MKSSFLPVLLLPCLATAQISPYIHIDQFGYRNGASKVAVISDPVTGFNAAAAYTPGPTIELRNFQNGQTVFSAAPSIWNAGSEHTQSGDKGWWFDFSAYTTDGTYYVHDPATGAKSAPFNINSNPYRDVLGAALRMFYYNRCNFTKESPYVGAPWTDGMNFNHANQDANCRYAYDQNNPATEKNLTGGWFDAGDYNKYVTFAHDPVHHLLSTYEEFPALYGDDWNWPESGDGLPDILNEVKWELDWLLKMVNPDGSVPIKMGSVSFSQNISAPPSANIHPRFYGHTCTSASIAAAGMLAHASKVFAGQPGMAAYSDELKNKAILCWNYFLPFYNTNSLQTNCDDGLINAGDADRSVAKQREEAVIAAAYLFDITGGAVYDSLFQAGYDDTEPIAAPFWGPYTTVLAEALLHYSTLPGANAAAANNILAKASSAITNNWNDFYAFSANDLYRAESPDWIYHWGSNLPKAGIGLLCMIFKKYNLVPAANVELEKKAHEQLHYFHGVNPLGLVYLSNMYQFGGDRCVDEIYHTWFQDGSAWDHAIDSAYGPAPGFMVGGPNHYFSVPSIAPPANQPRQKSYLDFNDGWPDNSWEISEPAIYSQAIYARLLANFVTTDPVNSYPNIGAVNQWIEVFPNPTGNFFTIKGILQNYKIEVLDSAGSLHQTVVPLGSEAVVDVSSLPAGLFFIKVENLDNMEVCVVKIIKGI